MRLPKPPEHPSPSPSPSPFFSTDLPLSLSLPQQPSSSSNSPVDFSPPLIAMVVIAAAAFLLVTYSRLISRHLFPPLRRIKLSYHRWRCRRHSLFPPSDTPSFPPQYDSSSDAFYVYSPYGLDDSVIKNIPLSIYKPPSKSFIQVHDFHDCAVCLLDFEDGDYLRTLPRCYHSFHADCIDMWLRAHANCPLCRAGALFPPMTPLMAARIRPSLDETLSSMFLEPLPEQASGEIQPDTNDSYEDTFSPQRRGVLSEDHRFLLKRSHSFSFERSFASERVSIGAATAPHRHQHQHQQRRRSLWMKGASSTPFRSIAKSRVFSFRSRMMSKSPRHGELFPMSETSRSRRMKSPTTMMGKGGVYSSSRMRLGDPEALISPERYGRGGGGGGGGGW